MSLLRLIRQQLGLSVTPANNFTLDASADNGTLKLARGNAGATTQDIMTVDAAGKVDFKIGILGFEVGGNNDGGYIRVPVWLGNWLFQFATAVVTTNASGAANVPLVVAYPNLNHHGPATLGDDPGISVTLIEGEGGKTASTFYIIARISTSGAPHANAGVRVSYVRFGKAS